ncbi:MAG: ABC transporter substrate-binding protein [Chloroflexota bacterium]
MFKKRLTIVSATLIVILIASISSAVFAANPNAPRNQTAQVLNIGVLGASDSPTAQGVILAVQRFNAQGALATAGGTAYTLAVVTANATTAQEMPAALDNLKKNNVVAIFGPDDDKLATDSLPALNGAGVPIFTAATTLAVKGGGLLFRTRAADNWRMSALADVLLTDLKKTKFAIYQGTNALPEQVSELVSALSKRGNAPAPPVIQTAEGKVSDSVKVLLDSAPEAIIAFGDPAPLAELLRTLSGGGYTGLFVTPRADNRTFIQSLPEALRGGIYGVTTWPYSWDTPDSADFLRDYVASFGTVPSFLSASAYDSAVALIIAIKNAGIAPNAIHDAMLKLPNSDSLQGRFNPALGNNDLTASVSIVVTNRYGTPILIGRYEETGRVKIVTVKPTNVPPPTLVPTATPDGVVGTMKNTINVRSGPGANYDVIGQLKKNEQQQLVGANQDLSWYVINFRQQQGWISAPLVSVFGDARTLPVVAAPPTPIPSPTPLATATSTAPPQADIILVSASMNPPVPQPGVPFTLLAVIKNQGNIDAPAFAIATSFKPGDVYSAVNLPGLGAGQQTTISLTGTVNGTGIEKIGIVLDLNKQVDEGPNGEANNLPEFAYKVDNPYLAQGTINLVPVNSVDFQGGTPDVSFDGNNLAPLGATKLGILSGVQLGDVTYDYLSPDKIAAATPIPTANLTAGSVIGIYTAEGKRGVLRVQGFSGSTLILDYFIYGP